MHVVRASFSAWQAAFASSGVTARVMQIMPRIRTALARSAGERGMSIFSGAPCWMCQYTALSTAGARLTNLAFFYVVFVIYVHSIKE